MKKLLIFNVLLLSMALTSEAQVNEDAIRSLLKRVVPENYNQFDIEYIQKEKEKDVFELESRGSKIILRGNNNIGIASALNYYLKNYCNSEVSWNNINLKLPDKLPIIPTKIRKSSPYKYRYYLNYVTFNYSLVWWDWERWEREIDWMALNGINIPLALTGQNAVWKKVYESMGIKGNELEDFFSGPAYTAFNWMGLLNGWAGPMSANWMTSHKELQKKILQRERELGMTPVLPAFNGHVPSAIKEKFPDVDLYKVKWQGFSNAYMLNPNDPLFVEIGKRFIKEQKRTYGTDNFYSADAFIEVNPPSKDPEYLHNLGASMYKSMAEADSKATWIMQGWMFHYLADFWQPTQIEAFLSGIPDDSVLVLDLYSENYPVWKRTQAYYGKPWIWNMLHNFGGTISLFGRMPSVAEEPSKALQNESSGKMSGIGLTMEGIEQNPAIYALMMENIWRDKPIDLEEWIESYTTSRYGDKNEYALKAWQILRNTVYDVDISFGGAQTIITGRPTLKENANYTRTVLDYDPQDLLSAWKYLLQAVPNLENNNGFQYDLVDVTRQILANYGNILQRNFSIAFQKGEINSSKDISKEFLELIDDMDVLLSTREEFLLGKWLADAKGWGNDEGEKYLYEKNARNILTLWGDEDSGLHDYAGRQWSGLLKGFYKPRWEQFFKYIFLKKEKEKKINMREFEEKIKKWEWEWINGNELYQTSPKRQPVEVVKEMYEKYFYKIKAKYQDKNSN